MQSIVYTFAGDCENKDATKWTPITTYSINGIILDMSYARK